jgi:hypothetical protein
MKELGDEWPACEDCGEDVYPEHGYVGPVDLAGTPSPEIDACHPVMAFACLCPVCYERRTLKSRKPELN